MDPDPGGPKAYGSGFGSGSATLLLGNLNQSLSFIISMMYQRKEMFLFVNRAKGVVFR
jgi:hypothetical protein